MATIQYTVTEGDLRRCGSNIAQLRQCHEDHEILREQNRPKSDLEVSFKSAFRERCFGAVEIRDPWKGMERRKGRDFREEDYTLNEVLPESPKARVNVPPRPPASAGKHLFIRQRSSSRPCSSQCSTRAASVCSGRPQSGSQRSPSPGAVSTSARRLRMCSEAGLCQGREVDESPQGSVKEWEVDANAVTSTKSVANWRIRAKKLAVWLSLDAQTGTIHLYPRAAASRLEDAREHNRSNVPLAGLGRKLEDVIVHLAHANDEEKYTQQTLKSRRDVKRIEVSTETTEVQLYVLTENGTWHFSDTAIADVTEERSVEVSDVDMVSPPLPVELPQENRKLFYCSSAAWGMA